MEDTKVCKGHYAYMFRVDLSCNQEASSRIAEWLDKFNWSNWTGCHEIGEETGKHHYQMCVWREHKFTTKEQVKARNWWRGKTNSNRNGCALSSARKILSLVSYSKKDENGQLFSTICNLSKEQLQRIPKWESKRAAKVKKDKKFQETVKSLGKTLPKSEFLEKINHIYFTIYGKPCLFRNTYIQCLYRNGYMNDKSIVAYTLGIMRPSEILADDPEEELEYPEIYSLSDYTYPKNKKVIIKKKT